MNNNICFRNDHYSGDWASFNLQGLEKWVPNHQVGQFSLFKDKYVKQSHNLWELKLKRISVCVSFFFFNFSFFTMTKQVI